MSFADAKKMTTLAQLEVARTERISPNFVRVTLVGDDVARIPNHGFDHWFRLFLPQEDGSTDFDVPERYDLLGYLKYLRMPGPTRPHQRNYTVRELRHKANELDIDFVVHGDEGVATRWATRTQPGDRVALLDQGCGFDLVDSADEFVLAGDETGLPAVVGVLNSLPRDARGVAFIEIADAADQQPVDAPDGMHVEWLVRAPGARPGSLALERGLAWSPTGTNVNAYLCGEQALAAGLRRHLVNTHGVAKKSVAFSGYWKLGAAH